MSVHLLNQPDPDGPLDEGRLTGEFLAGAELFMEVPLSITHQFVLCTAAQRALCDPTCPPEWRFKLSEFVAWCAKHSEFPVEMRKVLAWQMRAGRERVQTRAPDGEAGGKVREWESENGGEA